MKKNYSNQKKFWSKFNFQVLSTLFTFFILFTNNIKAQDCTVNAGINQTICASDTFTLNGVTGGNIVSFQWQQIAGPSVVIVNPTAAVTNVLGAVGGNTYTFRISAVCNIGTTFQDVTYTVNPITIANAGSPIDGCPGSYNLSANTPLNAGESGVWSIVGTNNAGVTISTTSSPTSSITFPTNVAGSTTLRWTINNPNGCSTSDDVIVTNYGGEVTANAGTDQNLSECYTTTQNTNLLGSIGGNGTGGQTGSWTFVSGPSTPTIVSPNAESTAVNGLIEGTYVFRWTVTGPCAVGTDEVSVVVPAATQSVTTAGGVNRTQRFCLGTVTSTVLEGNIPLYSGETVQWTQIAGPAATITSPNSPTTIVTGLDGTSSYTFRYTINGNASVNPLCTSSINFTVSYFNNPVTVSINGGISPLTLPVDATSGSVSLTNTGGNAYQTFVISSPSGTSPSLNTSGGNLNFSGLSKPGTYVFRVRRYTNGNINTGCNEAFADITVISSVTPTISNAGTDVALLCGVTTTQLSGNNPNTSSTGIVGYWAQVSGPNSASFDDINNFNANVSGLVQGIYVFRWNLSGGVAGTDFHDDVQVTVSIAPTSTIAPPPDPICAGTYKLQADALIAGQTGLWTQLDANPAVTFTDATDPNSYVTNLNPSSTYTLRWTVTSSAIDCPIAQSDVTLNTSIFIAPSPADAGSDQCLVTGTTSATLGATPLLSGSGEWSVISQPAGPIITFVDNTSATTSVNGLTSSGTYVLQWRSFSDPSCAEFTDTMEITISDPPAANAGPDQTVCTSLTGDSVVMAANTLASGLTGTWIQISGDSNWTVDDINSPTATFSSLAPGNYVFEWRVEQGNCASASDTMSFIVSLPATVASTSPIPDFCGTSVNLSGNTITNGVGTWQLVSGPNNPTFANINDPTTLVSGLVSGTYTFRWTSANGMYCPTYTSDVSFIVEAPANAGPDQNLCNATQVLLIGTEGSTGTWTETTANGAVITPISSYTAVATVVPGNSYTFQFDNGASCGPTDTMNVVNSALPTTPDAGSDQEICLSGGTTVTMAANTIVSGTGSWALISGPNTPPEIGSNNPSVTFTGLIQGLYIFEWRSSNGNCSNLKDVVRVNAYEPPSLANAGPNQNNACQLTIQLDADTPTNGIGTWTLTSTPAGYIPGSLTIDSPNDPKSGISISNPYALILGTYQFTWAITNGTVCAPSIDTVDVIFNGVPPTSANAGPDQEHCDVTSVNLGANPVSTGSGAWSVVSKPAGSAAVVFSNLFSPNATASSLEEGVYVFRWTVSNGGCTLDDTVQITIYDSKPAANAGPDQVIAQFDNLFLNAVPATSPLVGEWTFVAGPNSPVILDVNNPNTQIAGFVPGTYEFTWTIENGICATTSDNVIITIIPVTDLSLLKTLVTPPSPIYVGNTLNFQVAATNNGNNNATGIDITDDLPVGYTIVPGSISNGGIYNSGTHEINWNNLAILNGATLNLTYQVTVNAITGVPNEYQNTVEIIDFDQYDPDSTPNNKVSTEDDQSSVTAAPVPLVDMSLQKTINNSTPMVGSNVTFTLTIANAGPSNATGVEVTDILPSGYTYISSNTITGSIDDSFAPTIIWNAGNINNGTNATMQIVATVNATGVYSNSAEITATNEADIDSTPNDNIAAQDDQDNAVATPIEVSDLELTKVVNNPTPNVGENVTFTITVLNNGPSIATDVDVTDFLPSGFTYVSHILSDVTNTYNAVTGSWVIPSLGIAASVTLNITATVNPTGSYVNFAEIVSADQIDPDSPHGNNDITEDDHDAANIIPINESDLVTTKTVDNSNPNEGDIVTFTISVNNNGGPTVATNVALTDILPTTLTYMSHVTTAGSFNQASGVWTIGTIAVDATATLNITVTVNAGTQGTTITNTTIAASGDQSDPTTVGDDLTETLTINAFPLAQNDESLNNPEGSVTLNILNNNGYGLDSDSDGLVDASTINLIVPVGALNIVIDLNGDIVGFDIPSQGTWLVDALGNINFTPIAGFTSNPTPINYTIVDNDGDVSNEATITITYLVNPPIAQNDYSGGNTTSSAVSLNVISNNGNGIDSDVETNGSVIPSTVSLIAPVAAINIVIDSNGDVTSFDVPGEGNWSVNSLGVVTFTPISSFTLDPTSINYTIEDNDGNMSNIATITIDYIPVPQNDYSTAGNSPLTNVTVATVGNDTLGDTVNPTTVSLQLTGLPGGASCTVTGLDGDCIEVTVPGQGVWSVNETTGDVTFIPEATFVIDPTPINYVIQDDETNVSTEAAIFVDYAPVTDDDLSTGNPINTAVTVNVLLNDINGDNYNPTTVSLVAPVGALNIVTDANGDITSFDVPGEGSWNVNLITGAITFTPNVGFITNPTPINYNVEDAQGNQSNNALVTVEYIPQADIEVLKTSAATYTPGTNLVYTISVTNNGPATATNVVVLDDITDPVLEAATTWSATNATSGLGDINENIASLNSGGSVVYTVTIAVPSSYTGLINNTASASSDLADPDASNNNATVATSENALSSLVLTKVVDNSNPNVGSNVVFTITVSNNGPSDATGIDVVDQLPSGYSFVSALPSQGGYNDTTGLWTVGSLSDTSVATLAITALVNATGNFTNIAEITSADQPDPNGIIHGNNTPGEIDQDDVTTIPVSVSNLITTKNVDNATPNTGDIVTYTLTVVNNGPSIATSVSLTDNLPTGTSYVSHIATGGSVNTYSGGVWNIGTIDIGDSATLTINALVTAQGTAAQTPIVNTATAATGDQFDPTTIGDDLVEPITVTASELVTTKTVAAQIDGTFDEGDTVVYTITVENQGPSNATNVSLVDLLPAGLTFSSATVTAGVYNSGDGNWDIGTITNGATETLTISAIINQGTSGNTIVNTTTAATGDQSDPNLVADDLTESITVSNDADIVLTKVVDNATPNIGDIVTYTITVTNKGESIVTNLVVTDDLPTGLTYETITPSDGTWMAPNWNIGTLNPGEQQTIVIKALVGLDQGGQTITNSVSNSQDQIDSNLTEDDLSATITVTSSDLAVLKTVSNATPNEGDTITYSIVVTNNGSSTATGVSLIDNLPVGVTYVSSSATVGNYNYGSGLWTVGSLLNLESATLTIVATVNDGTLGQTITNTTSNLLADQADLNPDNNIGSVSIVPTAYIDLSLTKTVVDDVVNPEVGDTITFEIRVNNDGPTEATGVQVVDIIPSGYDFINYSSSIGTYNPITGLWNIGFIEVGNTAVLLVDVVVLENGIYTNCAEITAANEIDVDSTPNNGLDTEDDYDCAAAPPIQAVDLGISKTVVANNINPLVETEVSFEIRLTNNGDIDATEVEVTDLLPSGYRFLNYSSTRGTYDYLTGLWNVGKIVNGETEVLVVDAVVNATGDYLNCASITALHQTDINTNNNTSCIATSPIPVADLELTKDVDIFEPYAETNVEFTINLTNVGPSNGTGVVVKDMLPSGYTFVSYSSTIGTYDANSGIWNVGTILNDATETLTIVAYVLPIGEWTNIAEVIASNEFDIDSTPGNNDQYEDDQASAATEPIVLLTIPEGFTPNGDGINEVFEIEHLEVLYPNFSMEIVNRYGNKVYEYKHNGNPYQTPQWWNGYSNGRWNFTNDPLPTGTYFYTIYFNNDERKPQTGWIYLRR